MNTLKEMGIKVEGAAQIINGYRDILNGLISDPALEDETRERLYITANVFFSKNLEEILRNKSLVLWSEPDAVTVHILNSSEECNSWIGSAEDLFAKYPIKSGEDCEMDEFKRKNRFACEISFEQFRELAGDEFDKPDNYDISECGLSFTFIDRAPVVKARAEGKI